MAPSVPEGHEMVHLSEPIAALFRADRLMAYELYVKLGRRLPIPGDDWEPRDAGLGLFLWHLYDGITEGYRTGILKEPGHGKSRRLVANALFFIETDQIDDLVSLFGVDDSLKFTTTPATYFEDLTKAFAHHLAPAVTALVRSSLKAVRRRQLAA